MAGSIQNEVGKRVADAKAEYIAYRDRAIEATRGTNVKVPVGANVQVCSDGAFVEATLWVPKEPA